MSGKQKKHFEVAVQRQRRGKMGIPLQRYDDSSFNNITPKKPRRKPVKCNSKTWRLNDVVEKEGKQ